MSTFFSPNITKSRGNFPSRFKFLLDIFFDTEIIVGILSHPESGEVPEHDGSG